MLDSYQRKIDYMRISITDRCHFQCAYCKSDHPRKLKHQDILSYEQLLLIVDQAIQLGINKFKITGGEPTIRKDYLFFIKELKKREVEVTLTTNGSLFTKKDLDCLKEIGIDGINFSIDTLDLREYFFHQCNRLRLTSTGKIKPCLFYEEMYDLKPYLNNEKQLRLHLEKAIKLKPKEHHFEENISYTRMNEIGG